MTWVITSLCRDCVDQSCVQVCPVDCIYEYTGSDRETFPNQLYIDPEECIDCAVCEPECPWEAIFQDEAVPEVLEAATALNASIIELKDEFQVPGVEDKSAPTPDQVANNKENWGYTG
ncbi:MAG: 4Fe-4S dicluster domain-containing protein [Gemmatimonadetes bacterium]|nr:4Fe-4S dicluster domain-containing protein [Gemmatimonadota bacterium]